MGFNSLDILSKDGAIRLLVEFLVVFAVFQLVYVAAVEPLLQSIAPAVYVQTGVEARGAYDLPDTVPELTHDLLSVVIVGSFLYWRLYFTELGQRLTAAVEEDHDFRA